MSPLFGATCGIIFICHFRGGSIGFFDVTVLQLHKINCMQVKIKFNTTAETLRSINRHGEGIFANPLVGMITHGN